MCTAVRKSRPGSMRESTSPLFNSRTPKLGPSYAYRISDYVHSNAMVPLSLFFNGYKSGIFCALHSSC